MLGLLKQMLNHSNLAGRDEKTLLRIPSDSVSPYHPADLHPASIGLVDQDNFDFFIGMISI